MRGVLPSVLSLSKFACAVLLRSLMVARSALLSLPPSSRSACPLLGSDNVRRVFGAASRLREPSPNSTSCATSAACFVLPP